MATRATPSSREIRRWPPRPSGAARPSASTPQSLPTGPVLRRNCRLPRGVCRPGLEQVSSDYQNEQMARRFSATDVHPDRRVLHPGNDGVSRVRSAGRQHHASVARLRRKSRTPLPSNDRYGRAVTRARKHRTARCAPGRSGVGARRPTSCKLGKLRDARLRVREFLGKQGRLRQRRAAVPVDWKRC